MKKTYPIKKERDIKKFKEYFIEREKYRDHLLITICLNTALRISDIIEIKWADIVKNGKIRSHMTVKEKKTGKESKIYINSNIKQALKLYMKNCDIKEYVFENKKGGHITRTRAYNIIHNGSLDALGYGIACHSLRKTFGYHAWKKGIPPAMLMDIYNHSNYAVTKRYLGITQDDRDSVFKSVKL